MRRSPAPFLRSNLAVLLLSPSFACVQAAAQVVNATVSGVSAVSSTAGAAARVPLATGGVPLQTPSLAVHFAEPSVALPALALPAPKAVPAASAAAPEPSARAASRAEAPADGGSLTAALTGVFRSDPKSAAVPATAAARIDVLFDGGTRRLEAEEAAPVAADLPARYAVIGVDIGGTHVLAGAIRVTRHGVMTEDILDSATMPTRLAEPREFYGHIARLITQLAEKLAAQGVVVLPLVGIGQPGRFIAAVEGRVIAPGSAANLGPRKDSFDGLDPEGLMREAGLLGGAWRPFVDNDAIAQMSYALQRFLQDAKTARILKGAKVAYLGPGTGLGGGFAEIGPEGKVGIFSDGHVYDLQIVKDGVNHTRDAVLSGIPVDGRPLTVRMPAEKLEDVLSGKAVQRICEAVDRALEAAGRRPLFAPVLAEAQADGYSGDSLGAKLINTALFGAKRRTAVVRRAQPAAAWIAGFEGRMLGLAMERIHRGDIVKLAPDAQWPRADQERARGTAVFVIGGTMGTQGAMGEIIRLKALEHLESAVPGVGFFLLPITFGSKTSGLIGAAKFIDPDELKRLVQGR